MSPLPALPRQSAPSSATDLAQLVATATDFRAYVPAIVADAANSTPLANATMRMTTGLQSWEVGFSAVYPRTRLDSARPGWSRSRQASSGLQPVRCDLRLGAEDVTAYTGAAQTFKAVPARLHPVHLRQLQRGCAGRRDAFGTHHGEQQRAGDQLQSWPRTAPRIRPWPETSSSQARATRKSPASPASSKWCTRFVGSGTALWTISAGDTLPALLPAGDIDSPDWDLNADGVPDVSATFTLASGRTLSGPCFLRLAHAVVAGQRAHCRVRRDQVLEL